MRRLLAGLLIATGLASAPAIARPAASFDRTTPPPAPDYADPATWAAWPGRPSAADKAPPGFNAIDPAQAQADVFFIHPTTALAGDGWNAAFDDRRAARGVDGGVLRGEASVFNGCCRIFAPRYRQATSYYVQAQDDPDSFKATDLAYGDVRRAFDYYLAHENHGRPIVIASHSQGSRYALRLLNDVFNGKPLQDQLVAAYVIGIGLPLDLFQRSLTAIKPCTGAADTGCVIAYDTIGEGGSDRRYREQHVWFPGGDEANGDKPRLCINPLDWNRAVPAPADAQCRDGVLWLDDAKLGARYRRLLLPGRDYHAYDYTMFYLPLRQNAIDRVTAFVASHPR